MKHLNCLLRTILLVTIVAVGMVACTEDTGSDDKITLSTESLEFSSEGGSKTVGVTTVDSWEATTQNDWIEVTQEEDRFTVTVGENETTEPREGAVTVKTADDTKTIAVKQQAGAVDTSLRIDPRTLSFPFGGETKTLTVTSESEWTVEVTSENSSWLTVNKTGDEEFTATAEPHNGGERSAVITVDNGEVSKTVSVTQRALDGTIDALEGTWSVTGYYWGLITDCAIEYNSVITKVDESTIRISPFLGKDAILEQISTPSTTPSEDWIEINYDNGTLTIPHKTRIDWWYDYSTPFVLTPIQVTPMNLNLDLHLPTYTVEGSGTNLSIDFQDPDGLDFSQWVRDIPVSFMISEINAAGGFVSWSAVMLGMKFTKISDSTTL